MTVYRCGPDGNVDVSDEMLHDFNEKGYVIISSLLNKQELSRLLHTVENDQHFQALTLRRSDGDGKKANLVLWNEAGEDVTGVVARCEKVAGTMEKLLGGEVYHYHSKLIRKDAHTGGYIWHQDYGYWYQFGCLYPNMGTVFIALDKAHKGNGCLQILEGSHKLGRADHVKIGEQEGISNEKMDQILTQLKPMHVELNPGDALLFHSNVIHKSAPNTSDDRRWALLCAYNRADNSPVTPLIHPQYSKMEKVPNSSILTSRTTVNPDEKDFMRK